eukprot:9871539-Alexandrium_andersonii.AAC.1
MTTSDRRPRLSASASLPLSASSAPPCLGCGAWTDGGRAAVRVLALQRAPRESAREREHAR